MICPRCPSQLAHELIQQDSGRLYCARTFIARDGHASDAGAMFEWLPDDTGKPTLTQVSGVIDAQPANPKPATSVARHIPSRSTNMTPAKKRKPRAA